MSEQHFTSDIWTIGNRIHAHRGTCILCGGNEGDTIIYARVRAGVLGRPLTPFERVTPARSVSLVVGFFSFSSSSSQKELLKMAAKNKQLLSLSGLASAMGKNFRTISKALADVKPDGRLAGRPAFLMSTAIAALEEHTRRTGYVRAKPAPVRYDAELETKIAELEAATDAVDAFLKKLRAEPSVERRRTMPARCIGRLDRALQAVIGDGTDAFLRKLFADDTIGRVIGEHLDLCNWEIKLADEEAAA
jgi:hypothetical protein